MKPDHPKCEVCGCAIERPPFYKSGNRFEHDGCDGLVTKKVLQAELFAKQNQNPPAIFAYSIADKIHRLSEESFLKLIQGTRKTRLGWIRSGASQEDAEIIESIGCCVKRPIPRSFSNLSSRAESFLLTNHLERKSRFKKWYLNKKSARNFGRVTELELCEWCGIKPRRKKRNATQLEIEKLRREIRRLKSNETRT